MIKVNWGRKVVVNLLLVCIAIIVILGINFIPTFHLKTKDMKILKGNWVDVYYETKEDAANDVFELADSLANELAIKLGFQSKPNVKIYIYDKQSNMQKKKYGFIGPLLGLDWYIGDNIGTNVILTSPANPGKVHNYDDNKYAALHELVHAYISVINPKIHLWLTEGAALYLANGSPFYKEYLETMTIPSSSDIKTRNPIKFANIGGYDFSKTYIEYLDITYGWDKVLELIKTEDYNAVFGKSQEDIYKEWIHYIENYYQ